MTVETNISKLAASVYTKLLFADWASDNWYYFALVLMPFAVLAYFYTVFIYISLMVLFIVIPMALALVYIHYAFSNEAVVAIRRGKYLIGDDKIEKIFYSEEDDLIGSKEFDYSDFDDFEEIIDGFKLFYKHSNYLFLLFRTVDFKDYSDYTAAKDILSEKFGE